MKVRRYKGACDASAALRIAGTTCFVTASDEDYVLRVYDLSVPGFPIAELDTKKFLAPIKKKKEPDIEGAAQIGKRIYWVGSHGRDKDGEEQESRQRLFATDVSISRGKPKFRTSGKPYTRLLDDLARAPELARFKLKAAAARPPEAPGGLNIEGLAATPEGHLLVGFRNPIPARRALIVRIKNPADVVAGKNRAKVAAAAWLDLGGRGIRAIESTGDGTCYILAGAFDDTKNFSLFRWKGRGKPTLLLDGGSLNTLNPEELIVSTEASGSVVVELFSDDGDRLVGGVTCKKADANDRSFRVATWPLSPASGLL